MKQISMLVVAAALAAAQARVALVIGNDNYETVAQLQNAASDSGNVGNALAEAGFKVTRLANAGREQMDREFDAWLNTIPSGATALFYYAGHAVEVNGVNYLLPVDVRAQDAIQVRSRSLSAQEVLDRIAAQGTSLQILVLDACRNNPFTGTSAERSIGGARGLASMSAAAGSLIAFSTAPRATAADTSVYATKLVEAIRTPGLSLPDVFARVGAQVQEATARRQVPWVASSVSGDFYFRELPASSSTGGGGVPPAGADEEVYWKQCDQRQGTFCKMYLDRFPTGRYADLAKLMTQSVSSVEMEIEYGQAYKAYLQSRLDEVFPILLRLANGGHADSMAIIARMYASGRGVSKNGALARQWIEKAEAGQSILAHWAKGAALAEGSGYLKNDLAAVESYRKGAALGEALAMTNLGAMYLDGTGVPKDLDQAAQWYRRGADGGIPVAMYNLGRLYANGEGIPKNVAEAVAWYRKAAEQGHADAMFNLGWTYASGEGVSKSVADAVAWYRKAADRGSVGAMFNLGIMYASGEGVPKNEAEAVAWFRKAAEQGYAPAMFSMGVMYEKGEGVPKNDAEAVTWFRKATEQGHGDAMYNLGFMYANARGVPKNATEAATWYRKAAEQGNADAMNNLGVMLAKGDGVPRNDAEAVVWYRKAADKGDTTSMRNLAYMLEQGAGVTKNAAEAKLWRERADKAEGK